MTTEAQREQQERKEVLRNDLRLRQQGATFHAFAQSDAALPRGRYTSVTAENVVGAEPIIKYPAASPHQYDPCGPEPALGYSVEEMIPVGPGPASEAPTGQRVAHAAG